MSLIRGRPWLASALVAGVSLAASLWLWFGPWIWRGIPWLVWGMLPFLVGALSPRLPLVFGMTAGVVPYILEGDIQGPLLVGGIGAAYLAAALGLILRRLILGVQFVDH